MKKKITIVLAVYRPKLDWFKLLLSSLNQQTYPHLELLVCNDCPEEPLDPAVFASCITAFPYTLYQNEKNKGSNKTFESLVKKASGDYIAFCDQDDIWEKDKLSILAHALEQHHASMVYSDLSIIDGNNRRIADSITKLRKRHIFYSGDALYQKLLVKNFVVGCAMLMDASLAKRAVPFPSHMVHDHWLAIFASNYGRLHFVNRPLVQYRQHDSNQTSVLAHVETKADYYCERLVLPQRTLKQIQKRFPENSPIGSQIAFLISWYEIRKTWWKRGGLVPLIQVVRFSRCHLPTTLFECLAAHLPGFLFSFLVQKVQTGKL